MESNMLSQTAARISQTSPHSPAISVRKGIDLTGAALHSIGTVCQFGRNQTVFSDGDDAAYSYKVVSGAVRLVKLMADGRRHIAGFQLPGDLFGIEWTGEYELTAEAVTEVTAIRYSRTHLERLSEERADIRKQLTERLRDDLRAAHDHLISLGCQSARERVASFLLLLVERTDAREGAPIEMPMGRQDIADYLGLTIETVCRTLSDLRDSGVIDVPNRHHIVVRNLPKLNAAAHATYDA